MPLVFQNFHWHRLNTRSDSEHRDDIAIDNNSIYINFRDDIAIDNNSIYINL